MYHSHLLINTGDNPDRVDWQRTRSWLRNLYRVHQRLCMAFPDKEKALAGRNEAERFAEYCKPFQPPSGPDAFAAADDETGEVHTSRNDDRGFLYRIDYPVLGSVRRPVIIVQSARHPDWDHAFGLSGYAKPGKREPHGNADFLLAAPPQVREVNFDASDDKLVLRAGEIAHEAKRGDQLWFILRANVVETRTENGRKGRHRLRIDDEIMKSGDAQRVEQARREVHLDWLRKKLQGAATLVEKTLDNPKRSHPFIETGWAHASRGEYDKGGKADKSEMQWWSVTFSGRLILKDPEKLRALLLSGIGPAKGFGFGLLSVGPVKKKSEA
jgi:CRISPR-associated protein Cas6/Cse3/CasE subtype I-E